MKTVLLFPPQWNPFQAYLSLPCLQAYLKGHGEEVILLDANVEFFHYLFSEAFVGRAMERTACVVSAASGEDVRARLQAAAAVVSQAGAFETEVGRLRRLATFQSLHEVKSALQAWATYLEAVSVLFGPFQIAYDRASVPVADDSLEQIRAFCEDDDRNIYASFYDDVVIPKLKEIDPGLIGISMIGSHQIYGGLTGCRKLKQAFPEAHVSVGGNLFTKLADEPSQREFMLDGFADSLVLYEGEEPLLHLIRAVRDDLDLKTVPNLVFRSADGAIAENPIAPLLDVNLLPIPEFTDLDLTRYFSPVPLIPYLSSRGCYWGKCAFCCHGMIYGKGFRTRSPELVAQDLEALSSRHRTRNFIFNDESVAPRTLNHLSRLLPKDTYSISCMLRFEKAFARETVEDFRKAGFKCFYFGMESASDRVLAHMRKNSNRTLIQDVLTRTSHAGIWNHVFAMFGFPTETWEEALETINFLRCGKDVHAFGAGAFDLERGSPIFRDPSAFGVVSVEPSANKFRNDCAYEVASGLSHKEAQDCVFKLDALERDRLRPGMRIHWVPRELLNVLLGIHGKDGLIRQIEEEFAGSPDDLTDDPFLDHYRVMQTPRGLGEVRFFAIDKVGGACNLLTREEFEFLIQHGASWTLMDVGIRFPDLLPLGTAPTRYPQWVLSLPLPVPARPGAEIKASPQPANAH